MNQIYLWLAIALMFLLAGGILGPLFWSLHQATKPIAETKDGWIETRRSPSDHVMGVMMLLTGVGMISGGAWLLSLNVGTFNRSDFQWIGGMLLGLFCLHGFLSIYVSKIRFNEERIEYRAPLRHINVLWNEVQEIKMGTNGPTVVTSEGRFPIANTRRGFFQLLETARKQDVQVQDSPYFKTP